MLSPQAKLASLRVSPEPSAPKSKLITVRLPLPTASLELWASDFSSSARRAGGYPLELEAAVCVNAPRALDLVPLRLRR